MGKRIRDEIMYLYHRECGKSIEWLMKKFKLKDRKYVASILKDIEPFYPHHLLVDNKDQMVESN